MLSSTTPGILAIIPSTQVSAALVAFALLSVFFPYSLAFSCAMIVGGNESAMNLRGRTSVFEVPCCELGANFRELCTREVRRRPRTRTSLYRLSAKFALIEYSEIRLRQDSYSWL